MKSSETVHCGLVEVGATEDAPAISVPSMIAGASRYLVPPFWSQEAMTSAGLSRLALAPALAEQVSFSKSATACAYCFGSTPAGAGDHRPQPQLGGLADRLGRVTVRAGHRDDDPVRALRDHLGLGDAEAVDPALDDLPGLVE